MTNRPLHAAEARGWGRNDDLTTGAWLAPYCPGRNGPSDIDSEPWHHVLHNCHVDPHRELTIEYKHHDEGGWERRLPMGQDLLFADRPGEWTRREDGLRIIRKVVVVSYQGMQLAYSPFEIQADGTYRRLKPKDVDDLAAPALRMGMAERRQRED